MRFPIWCRNRISGSGGALCSTAAISVHFFGLGFVVFFGPALLSFAFDAGFDAGTVSFGAGLKAFAEVSGCAMKMTNRRGDKFSSIARCSRSNVV